MDKIRVGPVTRVLVNQDGEAWPPARAAKAGIDYDIIFRRRDGWTLGAPMKLAQDAFELWEDEWTHYADANDVVFSPIANYCNPCDAYELNDPKHPTYAERMADQVDLIRSERKYE